MQMYLSNEYLKCVDSVIFFIYARLKRNLETVSSFICEQKKLRYIYEVNADYNEVKANFKPRKIHKILV